MKIRSCTFQTTLSWENLVKEELKKKMEGFLVTLNKEENNILGFLQSFTFPESFNNEQAQDLAHSLYDIYRAHDSVLLGGDTSGGPSLVVTIIALIK